MQTDAINPDHRITTQGDPAMTYTPPTTTLTKEVIEAMTPNELYELHRLMTIQQFANLRDQIQPCEHSLRTETDTDHGEPHGMHSDDGWDYLTAALDLASELHAFTMETFPTDLNEGFRTWLLNKIDPDHEDNIFNYACDGVSELLWTLLMPADED